MTSLAFREAGGGPSKVVFLHAFPFDGRMWKSQLSALSTRHHGLAVDLAGFGQSREIQLRSVDDHADAVAAFLDEHAIARATFVGLSMGGYIALALLRRHPERVAALFLADTRATADTPKIREAREVAIANVRARGTVGYVPATVPGLVAKNANPEVLAAAMAIAMAQAPETLIAGLEALRDRGDSSLILAAATIPVALVVGAEDALTRPDDMRAMVATVPGARFDEIAGAGHLSNLEAPLAFNRLLTSFCDEVAGSFTIR